MTKKNQRSSSGSSLELDDEQSPFFGGGSGSNQRQQNQRRQQGLRQPSRERERERVGPGSYASNSQYRTHTYTHSSPAHLLPSTSHRMAGGGSSNNDHTNHSMFTTNPLESASSSRRASPAPLEGGRSLTPTDSLTHIPPSLPGTDFPLQPPGSLGGLSSRSSSVSLSTHYIPTKFSSGALAGQGVGLGYPSSNLAHATGTGNGDSAPPARRRHQANGGRKYRSKKYGEGPEIPKMGGGVDAFRNGEARMGGENDEDSELDDQRQESSRWFGPSLGRGREGFPGPTSSSRGPRRLRWNKFKWILFVSNVVFTLYALVALVYSILFWFDVFTHADIVRVGNRTELIISTLAAALGLLTAMLGWAGILLNNRSFLAVYNLLLWITFIFLLIPGYMSYKRRTFNLEGKINAQWSRNLGMEGRLRIQDQLNCCGYFSPFVEATITQTCYSRSVLQGCKGPYLDFERVVLKVWYEVVFAIVPAHLVVMTIALLCSNHVTYRFGKGMMPKAYRLSVGTMAVIMDNYASQLVEQYGTDVAAEILARSRSTLQLDAMPNLPYLPPSAPSSAGSATGPFLPPRDAALSGSTLAGNGHGHVRTGPGVTGPGGGSAAAAKYETLATRPPLDSEDSLK